VELRSTHRHAEEGMTAEDILGLAIPVTYLMMLVVEKLRPARVFPKLSWWGFVGFGFLVLMTTLGVVTPLLIPVEWLASHRLLDGTKLGVAGGAVVGFVLLELVVYFYHRGCHAFSIPWRMLHQMHHAPQRVDIPGSTVFHPLELLVQNALAVGITVFALGLEPLAAAIVGYALGFVSFFQHWNVRTPRWLGYVIQRPEAHCRHHQRGVHAANYADLPIWDILFGTFENPATFEGEVGFEEKASYAKMLAFVDVNSALPSSGTPRRAMGAA
jgi:sterol desaturase/sphingolipid hydroxylase (fatty acid hydroxylase superfamily)